MGREYWLKWTRIALSLLLAVLMSAVALWPSWAAGLDDTQSQLDKIQQQIEQERSQLAQKGQQGQTVSQQLQQLDQGIVQTRGDLDTLNGNLTLLQTRIDGAQQDIQKTQASLDNQTHFFDQRLRDIYIDGSVSYLDVLFRATGLNDFLTRFDMLHRIAEQDISLMKQITAMRDQIAQNKKDLEDQKAQTVVFQSQALAKQDDLATRSQQKKQLLSQIRSQQGALQRDLDEDEAQSEQLTQIIQGLQNKNAPPQGTGHFVWPVKGPITSPFGWRINPVTHQHSGHTGIDIGVPYGTPIAAADGGTVIFAGWNVAYGNMTVIDHGGSFSTMYAHQSKQLVKVGDHVTQGQIIGYIGTTGWSTGPHLHFEIRVNGIPVNPMKYL
jgi:murein DD-endopeptidase MepM/ murein hydrolase activator NlpD